MLVRSPAVRRLAKFAAFLSLAIASGLPAAAADQGRPSGGRQGEESGRRDPLQIIDISSGLYLRALELKASGNCAQSIPIFYRLARRGEGFELAQFHLGECLMRGAEQSTTSTEFLSGLVWIRRAADAGAPQAQATLALFYLGGPEALREPAEAALWFTLFQSNPQRKKPGFSSPLSGEELGRLEAAFSEDLRAEAQERARNWQRKVWTPPDEGLSAIGENIPR